MAIFSAPRHYGPFTLGSGASGIASLWTRGHSEPDPVARSIEHIMKALALKFIRKESAHLNNITSKEVRDPDTHRLSFSSGAIETLCIVISADKIAFIAVPP